MYTKRELLLIWLDSFEFLTYEVKQILYSELVDTTDYKRFLTDNRQALISEINEEDYNAFISSASKEYLDCLLGIYKKNGIKAVTVESENYPIELKEIDCPPLVLYAKGHLDLLKTEKFSIVGSRKSLPISVNIAKEFANGLSKHFTLITGIAEGIDSAVLTEALSNGRKVVSVIAGGFFNIYPKSNTSLFELVSINGLALSENPPNVKPKPYFFPKRNRIIAALGKGTLIVNGGEKSGVYSTAEYAGIYGKDIFAIPYGINIPSGVAPNRIIRDGGILTTSPEDISEFYGIEDNAEDTVQFSDEEREILDCISEQPKHVDIICRDLDKEIFMIMPYLTMLEIKGYIVKNGVNTYGIAKRTEK